MGSEYGGRMPSKGLKYTAEISRLRAQGLNDGQIAERLAIGKAIVTRNLREVRTQQRLAKLATQAGLYALKQALVSAEVGWRWIEAERLKLLEGKSTLTAEGIGTLLRAQEKALGMARTFLGKNFRPGELSSPKDLDESDEVKRILREIEAEGKTVEGDDAGHA